MKKKSECEKGYERWISPNNKAKPLSRKDREWIDRAWEQFKEADAKMADVMPCPHCQHRACFGESPDGGRFLECRNCRASTRLFYPDKTDVRPLIVEAWNMRRYPAWILEAVAAGRAALLGQKAADDGYTVHDKAINKLEKAYLMLRDTAVAGERGL